MKTTKFAEIKTRCTTELKERLNEIAKQKNVSVSTIITSCLETYIYFNAEHMDLLLQFSNQVAILISTLYPTTHISSFLKQGIVLTHRLSSVPNLRTFCNNYLH